VVSSDPSFSPNPIHIALLSSSCFMFCQSQSQCLYFNCASGSLQIMKILFTRYSAPSCVFYPCGPKCSPQYPVLTRSIYVLPVALQSKLPAHSSGSQSLFRVCLV
jgi:hypothetical protein